MIMVPSHHHGPLLLLLQSQGHQYPDSLPEDQRPYCKDNNGSVELPVLDEKFIARAVPIVEKQLVLGGVHLAAFLKQQMVA